MVINTTDKWIEEKQQNGSDEFVHIIQDLVSHPTVQQMKDFRQHYDTSCFEHCIHVSYYSYLMCKKLHLDYISAARGGMLHDLFLYDWRKKRRTVTLDELHAFAHPKIALENAKKITDLTLKEQDIILKHMWPVSFSLPRYQESFVVTVADKYSAIRESMQYYQSSLHSKRLYRYAYLFLSLLVFRIV